MQMVTAEVSIMAAAMLLLILTMLIKSQSMESRVFTMEQSGRRDLTKKEACMPVPDPEVCMNAMELIISKGYPCEEHTVATEDGYILSMQRIPSKKPGSNKVVFLQHGLLCASSDWLTNLFNQSFAYVLADAGFDVWLGNSRGNTYSKKHVKYSPTERRFWAFTWDEMALYDLPAMVDYVLRVTSQSSLFYVGHSQGTLTAFAGLSENVQLQTKIKKFYALAPVSTLKYMKSPLKYLTEITPEISDLFALFGDYEFLPSSWFFNLLASTLCAADTRKFCAHLIFLLQGFDVKQLNEMYLSGLFQKYNYGSPEANMAHYGQRSPPVYDARKIRTPVQVFYGLHDWLADPQDVRNLLKLLPNYSATIVPEFDHLDFIWAMDARTLVYDKVIRDMLKVTGNEP